MAHAPEFDTKAFLAEFWPSAPQLHEWLANYGVAGVKPQAVYKWFVRESVPADRFALMIALLEIENGGPISLSKYFRNK